MTRIIAVFLLALSGCMDIGPSVITEPLSATIRFSIDSLATYDLEAKVFTGSDSLGRPDLISVGNNSVYVGDQEASKVLLVFDQTTGECIRSVGEGGQGPRELGYLWATDFKPGSDAGWLFDFTPKTLHFFDGDSLAGKTDRL